MTVSDYAEIRLDDETSVRVQLAPVGTAPPVPDPRDGSAPPADDVPDGFGGVTPVGRRGPSAFAVDALRGVLRPLGPLLQEVHDAVAATPDRPREVTVTFGVQVGQDLKLGIVGSSGQGSLTVSATWELPPRDGSRPSGAPGGG
ncbi:CU044_2847 family protein [Streptomyces capparidis]